MQTHSKPPGKAKTPIKKQASKKTKTFREKVFEVVKKIPRGQTMSYKQVAKLAGNPHAYRAVGNILNTNYDPSIPCHRVIKSNGKLGGYNRGEAAKEHILRKEKALGGA